MIHSAVALADQLKKCGGLKLREEDMRKWERELRVLNVTRASLTTQLVAARKQVMMSSRWCCCWLIVYCMTCPLIHALTRSIWHYLLHPPTDPLIHAIAPSNTHTPLSMHLFPSFTPLVLV